MLTALSDDSVRYFLDQAGRIPLLTVDEELLVARDVQRWIAMRDQDDCPRKVRRRGERAYNRMFSANLRLVATVAKKYVYITKSLEFADLLQEGCLGLSRAIEKFDPTRGYKFSTYAYWWVRQSVTRAVTQQDRVIRLPVTAIEAFSKLKRWAPVFQAEFGRAPTIEECALEAGVSVSAMEAYMAHLHRTQSLDRVANDDITGASSIVDLIPNGDEESPMDVIAEETEKADRLQWVMDDLSAMPKPQRMAVLNRLNPKDPERPAGNSNDRRHHSVAVRQLQLSFDVA